MRIHDLSPFQRPRERAAREGVSVLSETELLAIVLRSGRKNCSALELAQGMLNEIDSNLSTLRAMDAPSLRKMGLGNVQAVTLLAALELGTRVTREMEEENSPVESALEHLRTRIVGLPHEEFFVMALDLRNRCIGSPLRVARGTRYAVMVDVREVLHAALMRKAARIIVVHNHPSRDPQPSAQDILLTKQLLEASQWLDIELRDHIIVAGEKKFSFRENGMLT